MSVLVAYFWPVFEAAFLIGVAALSVGINRSSRKLVIAAGLAAAVGVAAVWHGPGGAADRFAGQVERTARQALDYYEMTAVTAHLHHAPLTRELVLVGPADDFQRGELVRLFSQLPGVSRVSWSDAGGGLPLIVEGIGAAAAGFLIGAVLAYLVELRRRYNAQWKW
ncbi:MAG TPA: hypothetical protein VF079_04615 [Sphingomicrobium sp.]